MRSAERLYLTIEGKVVPHGDERAHCLLVAAGVEIPLDIVRRYALDKVAAPAEEKAEEPSGPSPEEVLAARKQRRDLRTPK